MMRNRLRVLVMTVALLSSQLLPFAAPMTAYAASQENIPAQGTVQEDGNGDEQKNVPRLESNFDGLKEYSTGVSSIAEAEARLAELTAALPAGEYFSTDGKACDHGSSDTCSKCNYVNVMKKRLGLNTSGLAGGYTCYGFCCFVYYYLFHQDMGGSMSDTTNRSIVYECPFTEVVKYAVPGDIIKYKTHWVVYAGSKNGLPILYESNYLGTNIIRYGTRSMAKSNPTAYIWRNRNYAAALAEEKILPAETKAPEIRDVRIDNITADGFDVSCVVTDDTSVSDVSIESWHCISLTEEETPTRKAENKKAMQSSGGRYTFHVSRTEYGGQYGRYQTYIYATDCFGNEAEVHAGAAMLGTYADAYKDAFFCEVTNVCPVGFTYIYGVSAFPNSDLKVQKGYYAEIWSEEAGRDYQASNSDWEIGGIVAKNGGSRTGGSGDKAYTTLYLTQGASDKTYGYAKGIYHLDYSVLFTDGSVLNLNKTVELKDSDEPAKEITWNGHTYKLFFNTLSWEDAEQACERMGGHLVTITSEEEFQALTDKENGLVNNVTSGGITSGTFRDYYYLGGSIDPVSGKVNWVTGEESDFTAWENGGEGLGSDDHILMLKDALPSATYQFGIWKWSNVSSNSKKCGYICEIDNIKPAGKLRLNYSSLDLTVGEKRTFEASVFPDYSAEDIVLVSSDPSIIRVEKDSITAVGTGEAVVTAWDSSGQESAECKVKVTMPLENILVNKDSMTLRPEETAELTWSAVPANAYPVSYEYAVVEQKSDSDGDVIAVDSTRAPEGALSITAIHPGSARIGLKVSDGEKSHSTECQIKVVDIPTDVGNNDGDIEEKNQKDAAGKDTSGLWVAGIRAQGYEYTGSAIKPNVRVYYGDKLLRAGSEYSISYKSNVNVGNNTGMIVIKGKGAYSLTHTESFSINACSLETNPMVSASAVKGSKGVAVNVSVAGKPLKAARDFTLTETESSVILEGMGNYRGRRTVAIRENLPIPLSQVVFTIPKSIDYTAEEIELTTEELVLSEKNGKKLEQGKDYSVVYENNSNIGTATIYLTGITDGEGEDFSGTVKKTFKISAAKFTNANTDMDVNKTVAYQKSGAKPQAQLVWTCPRTGKRWVLRSGTDFKASYKNNNYPGNTAEMTITGVGCFKGSKLTPIRFSVVEQDISKLFASASDKAYNSQKKGSYYQSAPTVYDMDGKKLAVKKDYTLKYLYKGAELTNASLPESGDIITAEIIGTGAYAGSNTSIDYRVVSEVQDISKVKVGTIPSQEYTGESIDLSPFPVLQSKGFGDLTAGTDYEVIEYFNNVDPGTASVLVKGKGSFSGSKMINFKIAAQKWK